MAGSPQEITDYIVAIGHLQFKIKTEVWISSLIPNLSWWKILFLTVVNAQAVVI